MGTADSTDHRTLTRGWILSHQSLAWGTPAKAMQYLSLFLWRAKSCALGLEKSTSTNKEL